MRLNRMDKKKKVAIIVVAALLIFGGVWKYNVAYENSAEYITVTIADKVIDTYEDDEGFSSTTYVVYTHQGEEFNVRGEGWGGGQSTFRRMAVGQQYTILVAGLGFGNRDILSATHKPPRPRK